VPAFLQISAIAPDGYPNWFRPRINWATNSAWARARRDRFTSGMKGWEAARFRDLRNHYFSTTSTPTSAAWFSIRATNDVLCSSPRKEADSPTISPFSAGLPTRFQFIS